MANAHDLYLALGDELTKRQCAYRQLFKCGIEEDQIHEIRKMVNQELVLGREEFKDEIGHISQRQVRRGKDGRPAREKAST